MLHKSLFFVIWAVWDTLYDSIFDVTKKEPSIDKVPQEYIYIYIYSVSLLWLHFFLQNVVLIAVNVTVNFLEGLLPFLWQNLSIPLICSFLESSSLSLWVFFCWVFWTFYLLPLPPPFNYCHYKGYWLWLFPMKLPSWAHALISVAHNIFQNT